MASGHLVLADGVAVEEIDAVEVGQEVSFEEGPDRLVDPLVGSFHSERAVRPDTALDPDREAPARRGLSVLVDGSHERQHGAGARARVRDPVEPANEHRGLRPEVVSRAEAGRDAVSTREITRDDAPLDLRARG